MADLPVFIDSQDRLPIPARRLVVLVPGSTLDAYKMGRLVWALAMHGQSEEVLYLSVVPAPGDEIEISHQLAKLTSVTKDPRLQVSTQIQYGISWPAAVRKVTKAGDQILCLQDRVVRRWIAKRGSLARWVSGKLKVPVCLLS